MNRSKMKRPRALLRRLGLAYLTVSGGMFLFGFTSTLVYHLGR